MSVVNLIKLAIPLFVAVLFVSVLVLWVGGAQMPPDIILHFAGFTALMWTAYLMPRAWWS